MRRARDLARCAALVSAAVVLAACGAGPDAGGLADAEQRWQGAGVTDYTYTLTSMCGERALIGTFSVTVSGGVVSEVEPLDESAGWVSEGQPDLVPSIDDLFARLHETAGADKVSASYDPELGYPTSIDIDWESNGIDDEECYTVTDLTA